jgi:hypothetical protein
MTPKFVVGGCVVAFVLALVLLFVLTEPGDDLNSTSLILGTNGDSDVLILTSQSAAVLPSQVDNATELWGITPVEFLKALKMERSPTDQFLFRDPIKGWITRKDIPGLLALVDSKEPCASVALKSSTTVNTQGSTLGQEALFLLDGYRKGVYPPAPNSGGYDAAHAKELTDWAQGQLGPSRD